MAKIHKIPEQLVARIAAGEVIERPAYAVKELIENSLDAGADSITVLVEQSGLKKIVVTDNGEGMGKADTLLSYKPHTTSKLEDDSLTHIETLGFRGEALASIAAVSNLSIQSRDQTNHAGFHIQLEQGDVKSSGPIGMPTGTMVTITDLFQTIPARKKFLKSKRTEFRHIVDFVIQYALAYPTTRFLLIHNKRTILDLPKDQTLEDRIKKLLGSTIAQFLLPVHYETQYLKISGYLGHPQIATKGQARQYLFVNQRSVSNKLITSAIKDAFGTLLSPTQQPFYLIVLELPNEMVDVNVHPRKEHIGFINSNAILSAVNQATTQTLANHNLTFSFSGFGYSSRAGTTNTYAAQVLRESTPTWNLKDLDSMLKQSEIIQLHNLYLLVQTRQGFILIDQHAAHERILYEQLKTALTERHQTQKSITLKSPIIIDLPFVEMERIAEHLHSLQNFGFEIEEFSENSYRVDAVPELFQDRDIRTLILELLEELAGENSSHSFDKTSTTMLSFLACRSAIMAGESLTQPEARRLIKKLEQTPNNSTCPHGRPTKIEVSLTDLGRLFKRD